MSEVILRQVEAIIRRELKDDAIVLDRDTTADDVPFWDSLAHVRIMIAVEKAFSIHFASEELSSFTNVGELVDAIASKAS